MPYDITDAKDDIALLSAKIDEVIKQLLDKKILEVKHDTKQG